MLRGLKVKGFKSLVDVDLNLPSLTVLFGPNAAGKSNFLDALMLLSRCGTERTLADAIGGPIRGNPLELFTFPPGGLAQLVRQDVASMTLGAELVLGDSGRAGERFLYDIVIEVEPRTGSLSVGSEYLARLSRSGEPKGNPMLQVVDGEIHIRRKSKPARPRTEPVGLGHTQLSDRRFSGPEYLWIERVRSELSNFRAYYLDPRVSMREATPPRETDDIGTFGEDLAAFLYRVRGAAPEAYRAILRTLRTIIPSVKAVEVELDERRGTLDVQFEQDGNRFSSRIVSEGTLRVLALACIACNPWPGALTAFEEPENGVHPRRLELVAQLLASLALGQKQQMVVTTHSPLFCAEMLRIQRDHPGDVQLFVVGQSRKGSVIEPFAATGPLFDESEIRDALTPPDEVSVFTAALTRGLIDA